MYYEHSDLLTGRGRVWAQVLCMQQYMGIEEKELFSLMGGGSGYEHVREME